MAISLGTQEFIGSGNFPTAMVKNLATDLLGKDVTVTQTDDQITIAQGGTDIITFNIGGGGSYPWANLASFLFSQATLQDVAVSDRTTYHDNFSRGIDWRDMTQSTTINDNRFADSALTITANHSSFTIDGFGANNEDKLIGVQLQRNDSETGDGAMIEYGLGQALMRVNSTDNTVEINTTVGNNQQTWSKLTIGLGGSGNLTLGSGSDNHIIIEIVQSNPAHPNNFHDVIVGMFDGTNYIECNNLTVAINNVDGDDLGFSRSLVQRGQILRFSAINLGRYISHHDLELLQRNHRDDEWNYGYVDVVRSGGFREIVFNTRVDLADESSIDGEQLGRFVKNTVFENENLFVGSVTLPTDWADYEDIQVEVTADIGGGNNEIRNRVFSLDALKRSDINDGTHVIRIAGDTDLTFNPTTRALAESPGGSNRISRVVLYKR